MSNAITQLAKIIKNKLVRTVNGGAPDSSGNVDLSYMARLDKSSNFQIAPTVNGATVATSTNSLINYGGATETILVPGYDWNNLRATGRYTFAGLASMQNSPWPDSSDKFGYVEVIAIGGIVVHRVFSVEGNGAIYTRMFHGSPATWHPWQISTQVSQ